jgi:cytochrome c oxidase cbb3-type subunit 3
MIRIASTLVLLAVLPWQGAAAAPDGSTLFSQHCAACHGRDGSGGVGVPLSMPSFLQSVSDDYLRKSIRLGRPGRVMPAFSRLSDAETDAIVAHVRGLSDEPAPTYDEQRMAGSADRGRELFAARCAVCHGDHGQGGQGTGVTMSRPRDLPILAPALNNPGFLGAATDAMIKRTLMEGRKDTPMVSFLQQGLTEGDIEDVVAYVRSFEQAAPPKSAQLLETESPVIVRESPYTVKETVENLKSVILGQNFRLIRVQYLNEGFVPEGKEDTDQVIVYSCNFNFLNEALKVDPRVGLFLPCRATVFKHGDKVYVMSVNPKRLSVIFNNSELNELCEEMNRIYVSMIEEAVL